MLRAGVLDLERTRLAEAAVARSKRETPRDELTEGNEPEAEVAVIKLVVVDVAEAPQNPKTPLSKNVSLCLY